MASKIELYREVLEIEPNSKVFFPLARALSAQGHIDEAITVLQRGIGFHPDHLEAKFLLIDILTRQGREGEAEAVFTDVGSLLARYPSVWLLWSRAAADRSRDPALAMLFLGHYFQNDSLTWSEVMERGLRSLTEAASGGELRMPPTDAAEPHSPAEAVRPAVASVSSESAPLVTPVAPSPAPVASAAPAAPDTPAPAPAPVAGTPPLRGAQEVMELADLLEETPGQAGAARSQGAAPRGEAPVLTRTMASLLASQGDVDGALEIYDALIDAAPPGAERDELVALADALVPEQDRGEYEDEAVTDDADETTNADVEPSRQQPGAAKLVTLLETLAGRLEARSAG